MLRTGFLALIALVLPACATEGASSTAADRDCFNANAVRGYDVIDDRHVAVNVGARDRYVLTTHWNARDLHWTNEVALRSTTGFICAGSGLGVEIIGGEPRQTYHIISIERAPETAAPTS